MNPSLGVQFAYAAGARPPAALFMEAILSIFHRTLKLEEKKLYRWLVPYIEEKGRSCPHAVFYGSKNVERFINWLEADLDIYDITDELLWTFIKAHTGYEKVFRDDVRKDLNAWLRFWRNRGHKYLPQIYNKPDERWWTAP